MKIIVHAVGRMKAGPERELADRYFDRFGKSGPAVGLDFAGIVETPESRAQTATERKREEGRALQGQLQAGAALMLASPGAGFMTGTLITVAGGL